ncbi:MAG: hypothetical protein M1829_003229 [Trizodia sp. TS-e1964]|nr:MAG: hypothetical protein M1829_003229 [Trizodia sp. TS-e1964]
MPSKNLSAVHFLPAGAARLTDILFRQLRYDSIEHVIDICYRSCQLLVSAKVNSTLNQFQTSHETPQGVRFSVFHDIKFEELLFDDTRGLLARVSFFCPVHLRSTKVADALGTLEKGMLAALVGLGSNNNQLSTTFFEVHLRESTESMNPRGGNGMRAGAQLSFANPHCEEDVRRIVSYAKSEYHGTFLLVEFPKTLLAGFSHCLKQLQQQINLNTLPFSDYITSPGFSLQPKVIKPPAYSLVENFSFNLNCLKLQDSKNPDDLKLPVYEPDQRISYINLVKNETTLDEGQAEALCDNLTRELAFCQGPPGTGKSFLGSALVRTILASQEPEDKRPIIAVCMTNHALDSFLKDLIDHGVGDVVRLGRNSKENWISKYLLSNSRKSVDRSRKEQFEQTLCHINQQALASAGLKFCEAIGTSNLTWLVVKDHLKSNYPNIYDQFVAMDITESHGHQYRAASQIGGFGYRCWASGSDLDSLNQLSDELYSFLGVDPDSNDVYSPTLNAIQKMLATIQMSARDSMELVGLGNSIWAMSLLERNSLISQWLREINLSIVVEQMTILHLRHQRSVQKKIEMYKDSDKRVLLSKQVIGMTTTACAKNWSLLERVKPHVVICEEAGEVMEAQTLCTLFPSIQHAIFIGDPLQLRPQISQQALSLETEAGQSYRLDESLFERLMYPKYTDCVPIPTSHLTIQRRMHPEIADISRSTLYPYLKDHESTHMHFPVAGMVNRVYWFDHTSPEDQSDTTSAFSKSFSNTFEAEMVSNMVKYLMEQNVYDLGDIAVLTPYNCQLALLTKCLRSFFTIFLTDKDREALIDSGLLSQEELSMSGQRSKINLCDMLKVATIDNFQGEEAKVVIISTVRSNQRGSVGFLKTQNRINVACSRARDGFYIIGNAALMAKTNMWSTIVNLLKSKNNFAVDTLDSYVEFHRFYRNNDEGLLEKVNVPNTTDYTLPGCPSCGGSLRTVKRYSYIFRISQVMLVVDRLLEKLCRQTSLFVEELTSKKQSLALSFGLFQSQINPTPLAAASNKASIRERGNSFAPIEAKIKSLKDGMAALIEREISQLAGVAFAQDAVPYFHFRLMLNSLEFKCRQLTFKEGVKMADFLATLNDPSQHLQALAKGLEKLVGEQSVKIITQMASLIRNCEENHLPRLEVELTLLQAEIYRLSLTAETQSNLNTDECFERVAELCLRFPETAGKFQLDQTTVRKYAQKIGPTTTLYGNHVFEFWESLGKHATGQLVICENSHFFCGLTFDGCPECGKEDFFIAKAKEGSVSTGLW